MAATADIVLLHGDEAHLIDAEATRWRQAAAGSAMGIEVVEATTTEKLRSILAEMPLLDPRRHVLLRDPPQLGSGRKGGDAAGLAAALDTIAPSTSLCIVAHQKLTPTNAVLAKVTQLGGTVRAFAALKGRDLRQWLDREAATRGLRLPAGAAEHLLATSGPNLGTLSTELDKLVAFARTGNPTLDDVRRLAAGEASSEIWVVVERLLGPKPAKGAAAVDELLDDGRATQYLIATLAGQLRDLLQAQAALHQGVSPRGLAAHLKLPDWRADRLARQAQSVPATTVEEWMRRLQRLDAAIKNGDADDQGGLRRFARMAADDVTAARARRPQGAAR
jgi:DNA polymerase-3 subunit delta